MSLTSILESMLNAVESGSDTSEKIKAVRQCHLSILGDRVHKIEDEEALCSQISDLFPRFSQLQNNDNTLVRNIFLEILGEIGRKNLKFVPAIVNALTSALEDKTPAVARQAITCGIRLFRSILEAVALQGRVSSDLDEVLKSSWDSVLEFKETLYSLAFQTGSGGVRLLALKFVEEVILLFTPDHNAATDPPTEAGSVEFNVTWIRGGHPILNAGDFSVEASKMLNALLDQLRLPTVNSLSNLVIIVLTKSLANIAKKRPSYYGRILPVLLDLDPLNSVIKGVHGYGARLALKNGFETCLGCTHPSAVPWRDRLAGALEVFKLGSLVEDYSYSINGSCRIKEEPKSPGDLEADLKLNICGKRSGRDVDIKLEEADVIHGKRSRSNSTNSEEPVKDQGVLSTGMKDDTAGGGCMSTDDNVHVQQLVSMFGALVAQGEKAVSSLEILISSISADLLAEVVMENMRNLPPCQPYSEFDDTSLFDMTIGNSGNNAKYPVSFLAGVLSLSTLFSSVASQPLFQYTMKEEPIAPQFSEQHQMDQVLENVKPTEVTPSSSCTTKSKMDVEHHLVLSEISDSGNLENEIPGLLSSVYNDMPSEVTRTSVLINAELDGSEREQISSICSRSSLDLLPSTSTERSDEHSPRGAVTDASSIVSSSVASFDFPRALFMPKMSAPVVYLDDAQKDQLQIFSFVRIIDSYKYVALGGGSQVRFSLLACLGVEFPSEIDPWKLLQTHILSDYVIFEGHELTLRVLFRLFREVEEDRDLFSSTTATTAYETFLLAVAEILRESFPPSDKSLSKLLCEAPYIPRSVLNFVESLCCPESNEKFEELQGGDRVTQGLSTVWNLIMLRPPLRESCLKIALKSAVHELEDVRMKAIRLVVNKLFPLSSLSRTIEDFALQSVISVAEVDATATEGRDSDPQNDSVSSISIHDAQRCMSLYFALCTKKNSMFREIFTIYKSASMVVKQAVNIHMPILVRTIGSSPGFLEILSNPPTGSEELLVQVLQTLTEGTAPSPELIVTIKKLYDLKIKDPEILILILPFLEREEVLFTFSRLVNLPLEKFQKAVAQVLQGFSHSGPLLTPADVLIGIHGIDPERDGIPLKKVTDACNSCFEQPQIFTQQVLAMVLNQLVEQIPLPLLFMRTVLQAIGAYPALVDFVLEILSRLVNKQIWKYPKLWVGFLKCAALTKPQSFGVLLQLPPPQLENALNRTPALKAPLVSHASQPQMKSSLPRSILTVLGIQTDTPPPPPPPPPSTEPPTDEGSNQETDAQIEIPAETVDEPSTSS